MIYWSEADGGKIAIALSNLVKNAIMFTDENGHVFVTGELVPGYVKVSVIDDGIGIPPKDVPHIFDRFFQVESHLTRRHGGMGLGTLRCQGDDRDAWWAHLGGKAWRERAVTLHSFCRSIPRKPKRHRKSFRDRFF